MKMEGIVNITPGIPITRIRKENGEKDYYLYNNETFLDDFEMYYREEKDKKYVSTNSKTKLITTDYEDIILNMSTSEAAMVMQEHVGYALPYNYSKLTVETGIIDKYYLLFWINESQEFHQQVTTENQPKNRITVSCFNELKIDLPSIEEQRVAGKLYREMLELTALTKKRTKIINQLMGDKVFLEVENNEE